MYITIMDYSTEAISIIKLPATTPTTENIESLLESVGFHLSQIAYMTTEEIPEIGEAVDVDELTGTHVQTHIPKKR